VPRELVLVTGNLNKVAEAERLLGHKVEHVALDLPELQELDLEMVLRAKVDAAWQALGRPVVVDDTALELHALNGFPGPLIKWLLHAVGPEGVSRIALAQNDPRALSICMLAFFDGERHVFAKGVLEGTLIEKARGDNGFGFDVIFVPEGEERTFAELSSSERDAIGHRGRAWRLLQELLA
jgi:non-canonical purine NTP pyrophosphatase (RdgB/HAM1 family)